MNLSEMKTEITDNQIITGIKNGEEFAFEKLFFDYYYDLCLTAVKITHSTEAARDVVQDVFLNLCQINSDWKIEVSLKAYLYKCVWNRALNYKRKQKAISKVKDELKNISSSGFDDSANQDNTNRVVKQI